MPMITYSRDNYDLGHYRIPSSNNLGIDQFSPSIQSLKAAQDIVRRHEKKRRAAAKLNRQRRGAFTPAPSALGAGASDNIIPLRSPLWARPSSRLFYSRHSTSPNTLSPAPRARRASIQAEARRVSHYLRAPTAKPINTTGAVILDGVAEDTFDRFAVMAIQALAIILGLGALLALLTML